MGIRPVANHNRITQLFGTNPGGNNPSGGHTGTDYGCPEGEPVVAIAGGTVVWADWGTKLPGDNSHVGYASRWYMEKASVGIGVVIKHDDVWSTYSHLSRTDLNIGDTVQEGQVIGYVGATGLSFGSHLHFEIIPLSPNWSNGMYGRINPAGYTTGNYYVRSKSTPVVTTQQTKETYAMGYPYTLHTKWTSPNRSSRASFGHNGKPNSIVLHWWNSPDKAGTFEGTISWLCKPEAQVSAHYVISGKNIACIVSPDEAAWHSGTAKYNGCSIGIEIDPRLPAGTMESVYQLCYELEVTYGSMLFYGHKDVNPGTACPGDVYPKIPTVINKVNELHANKGKVPTAKAASTPAKAPTAKKATTTPAPAKSAKETNPTGWSVWSYKNPKVTDKDAYAVLNEINSKLDRIIKKTGA